MLDPALLTLWQQTKHWVDNPQARYVTGLATPKNNGDECPCPNNTTFTNNDFYRARVAIGKALTFTENELLFKTWKTYSTSKKVQPNSTYNYIVNMFVGDMGDSDGA